jgi:crotonobetainyl-CoA:carnitine CoA-transferase CaiB-like acyl-CoA transferase
MAAALLDGVRVLEVGQVLAGPYCGMVLADLGADVIKIEPPGGDLARGVGTIGPGGVSSYFASLNRNKRSIVLDLATDDGQQQLGRLVAESDALLVNLKGSTIRKLGLTYDALKRWNERIVCVAITGYGLDGSRADRPAFDYVVQAETGIAAMTGEPDGPPSLAGYSAIDNSVAVFAALGLVSAVHRGTGGQLDVSMHDVALSQLNYRAAGVLNGGGDPGRNRMGAHGFYAPAQLFATSDGHLAVFVAHDAFWRRLALELGGESLVADPRFVTANDRAAHREELAELLTEIWKTRTTEQWVSRLTELGVPVGPVASLSHALEHPFVSERGMLVDGEVRLVGNPVRVGDVTDRYAPAPLLGQHDDEVLGARVSP